MAPSLNNKEAIEAPMNGGDGPNSYSKNSTYQRGVIDAAKSVILQAITESLDIDSPAFDPTSPFLIADLGCSTGPNTFLAMQNIVEAVKLKYKSTGLELEHELEFQALFNDHTENDFNVLFRSLPSTPPYYAAGVPGSFYGRLFPRETLHIVHSSYAMQWLSKVPKEVQDRTSAAWNKGKIHYDGSDVEVTKAFYDQFKTDMESFLKARAEELVVGGLVFLQIPCTPNEALFSQVGAGLLQHLLGSCLVDLANMGVIKEESVDNFNLPQYHPKVEELEKIVEGNKSFTIEKMEILCHPLKNLPFDVQRTSSQSRAIMEGLMKDNFGSENMDKLFDLFTQKLQQNYNVFDKEIIKDADLFVVLKRN